MGREGESGVRERGKSGAGDGESGARERERVGARERVRVKRKREWGERVRVGRESWAKERG